MCDWDLRSRGAEGDGCSVSSPCSQHSFPIAIRVTHEKENVTSLGVRGESRAVGRLDMADSPHAAFRECKSIVAGLQGHQSLI